MTTVGQMTATVRDMQIGIVEASVSNDKRSQFRRVLYELKSRIRQDNKLKGHEIPADTLMLSVEAEELFTKLRAIGENVFKPVTK